MRKRHSVNEFVDGILKGDRAMLGMAITLVESALESDQALASEVLSKCMPHTGKAMRIGLTGAPGVGKSTFLDAFGTFLTQEQSLKVAVLAVDPSSTISKGSILGDKTRMERLSKDPLAFIRPSPSGGSLGGVARRSREALLLCEAAGYNVIFVETVGVGQSELAVHSMVDFFLLLMLPGSGDELQGIKKGIIEMADAIVINKADGDLLPAARIAQAGFSNALRILSREGEAWRPQVKMCSALEGTGLPEVWEMIGEYFDSGKMNGDLSRQRTEQALDWMRDTIDHLLSDKFHQQPVIIQQLSIMEEKVRSGEIPPTVAALRLVNLYFGNGKNV